MKQQMTLGGQQAKNESIISAQGALSKQRRVISELNLIFPEKFVTELERFKAENAIALSYSLNGHQEAHCCPQCLKAHALRTAHEQGLDREAMLYLDIMFPGEAGHDGYYLNQEELFRV